MKLSIFLFIFFHGLIHLFGFIKAFNLSTFSQLSQTISRTNGILWLTTAVMFITTAVLFYHRKDLWWVLSLLSIIMSQVLIFISWHDSKYGSIANLLILLISLLGYESWSYKAKYENEVRSYLAQTSSGPDSLLLESDIKLLPEPVKKYLHYTEALNKPKIKNFKVEFSGQIRKNAHSEWMPFTSEQYNFIEPATRLFFMKARMNYMPLAGFHSFKNGTASMDIRLFSLFKVQYQAGKEMGIAETVTFFNDMCCMAPATLIDKRIKWLEVNDNKVKAEFTNNHITINAWLYFNQNGELINFTSEDRYATEEDNKMKKIPWSTPLKDYKETKGHKLATSADLIYSYPSDDLTYGIFKLIDIEYNCNNMH